MTDPLPDTWYSRDLPVLRAVVQHFDQTVQPLPGSALVDPTGLTEPDIAAAARNLNRGRYVELLPGMQGVHFKDITDRALTATGAWPSTHTMADRLLATLDQRIEQAATPEEATNWRKFRDFVGGVGRDFVIDLAAAMIPKPY